MEKYEYLNKAIRGEIFYRFLNAFRINKDIKRLVIDELREIIESLKKDGKTVIIITHKLKEIKKSSKDCTIIRKGKKKYFVIKHN